MGIMVCSLLWVMDPQLRGLVGIFLIMGIMQDLYHQPYQRLEALVAPIMQGRGLLFSSGPSALVQNRLTFQLW